MELLEVRVEVQVLVTVEAISVELLYSLHLQVVVVVTEGVVRMEAEVIIQEPEVVELEQLEQQLLHLLWEVMEE